MGDETQLPPGMHKMVPFLVVFVFGLVVVARVAAQPSATATLIKGGRLLDPRSGNVLSPAAVLIESGKIKEVGTPTQLQAHTPNDSKTIDLGNATLLPGLIDSHTHLLVDLLRRRKRSGRVISTAAFCRDYCWRSSNRPASES